MSVRHGQIDDRHDTTVDRRNQHNQHNQGAQHNQHDERGENDDRNSLKGTLFSVMMVGAFIGLMWAGVFWLYMERF